MSKLIQRQDVDSETDEKLMGLYCEGDYRAFEILYERHAGRIFGFLKRKLPPETARDVLQDIFEKLHRHRKWYKRSHPFLPWLFTIARNALIDYLKRSEMKLIKFSVSSDPDKILPTTNEATSGIESPSVETLLSLLSGQQKTTVEMRYLKEWSFEKIAAELQTSQINARQILSRGMGKIRKAFKKS